MDFPDDVYHKIFEVLRPLERLRWRLADARVYRLLAMSEVDERLAHVQHALNRGATLYQTRSFVAFIAKHRGQPSVEFFWERLAPTTQTRALELKRAMTLGVYDDDRDKYPTASELRCFDPSHELVRHMAELNDPERFDAFQNTPHFRALFYDDAGLRTVEMQWLVTRAPHVLAEHVRNKARIGELDWPIDVLDSQATVSLEGYAALKARGISDERMSQYLVNAIAAARFDVVDAMTRDGYRIDGRQVPCIKDLPIIKEASDISSIKEALPRIKTKPDRVPDCFDTLAPILGALIAIAVLLMIGIVGAA